MDIDYLKKDYYSGYSPERETNKELYQPYVRSTISSEIVKGDIVNHKTFGKGLVIKKERGLLTIYFPGEKEKIIAEEFVEKCDD